MTTVEQNALLALAGLLVLLGGVLPLLRRLKNRSVVASQAAPFGGALPHDPRSSNVQPRLEPGTNSSDILGNALVIEAETVRALVTNDPARTARVIKEWLARDRSLIGPAV